MRSRPVIFSLVILAGAAGFLLLRPHPVRQSPAMPSSTVPAAPAARLDASFSAAVRGEAPAPENQLAEGEEWLREDPTDADARVSNLVLALCQARRFQTAVELANEAPADLRDNWLKLIFTRWALAAPQSAMAALASVADPAARAAAFRAATDSWAGNQPATLADYVASLPDGADKTYALDQLVGQWSLQDPTALANWLNTSPPGVDFDQAIAEMISKTDTANRPPSTAMTWVESMSDPDLKWTAFLEVLLQWKQADAADARQYVGDAAWLDDRQRQIAIQVLETPLTAAVPR